MRGRTVITIAHRLNTVRQADRIVVMEGGHLVESGNHQELLALNGIYANLVGADRSTQGNPFDGPDRQETKIETQIEAPITTFENGLQDGLARPLVTRKIIFSGSAVALVCWRAGGGSNVGLMATSAHLISSAALHLAFGIPAGSHCRVRFFGKPSARYAERLASRCDLSAYAPACLLFNASNRRPSPLDAVSFRDHNRIMADASLENFYVILQLRCRPVAAGMAIFAFFDLLARIYCAHKRPE
jgi:hypothetical protein